MKAKWDDSDSSSLNDDDFEVEEVANICLIAMVDDDASDGEEVSTTYLMDKDDKEENEINDSIDDRFHDDLLCALTI